ncbi:hypothetical protein JAB5_27670 [Janthinobacterium sp. HH103]|nr:hypothetical protein JAB2_50870 [Janthinobacterium sp. HH100]OEZ76458.1 hypothetical protein JAB5_27670 [Janthinobacterium sp. HH103]QOU76174.1 hypothetical protein JAB4_056740 [Janthinobacterium sp. HH102]
MVALRPLALRFFTSSTTAVTNLRITTKKCSAEISPRSIRRQSISHFAVKPTLFNSAGRAASSIAPASVSSTTVAGRPSTAPSSRTSDLLRTKSTMPSLRVRAVPIPFVASSTTASASFLAWRDAKSMSPSKLASVYLGGGLLCVTSTRADTAPMITPTLISLMLTGLFKQPPLNVHLPSLSHVAMRPKAHRQHPSLAVQVPSQSNRSAPPASSH